MYLERSLPLFRLCRRHFTIASITARRWRLQQCVSMSSSAESLASKLSEDCEPLQPPTPDDQPKQYAKHIVKLVDDIANLSLLDVADLNKALKERLNLPDAPVMSPGMMMAAPAQQAEVETEEEAAPVAKKSSFNVKVIKYDEAKKISLIKEVKKLVPGLNLLQAKKFVEELPQIIKEDIPEVEAEALKTSLAEFGAICEVE